MLSILGKEIEVGRVYTVGMPKPSVIPSEGRSLIIDLVKSAVTTDEYSPDVNVRLPYFMIDWDEDSQWEWLIHKGEYAGTLPKRISAYTYKKSGFKLPPATLSEIGNIARRYTVGMNEYHFDFNTALDWQRGQFGDHGSCFWSERLGARDMIKDAGGYAIRFFREQNDPDSGYARCWIIPHPTKSMIILFNIYGFNGNQIVVPRILSEFLGTTYNGRSVQFRNNGDDSGELYINGGSCWLVGQDAPGHTDRIDLEIEDQESDRHRCCGCGEYFHEDDGRSNDDGDWYCYVCYNEHYGICNGCDMEYDNDDLRYSNVSGECYCESCYDERFYICFDCGHEGWRISFSSRRGTSHEVGDEVVCDSCFELHYFECDHCGEDCHNDDAKKVKSSGEDKVWCKYCASRRATECVDCHTLTDDNDLDEPGRCEDCRMKVEEDTDEKEYA